jgi:hypothetical protein
VAERRVGARGLAANGHPFKSKGLWRRAADCALGCGLTGECDCYGGLKYGVSGGLMRGTGDFALDIAGGCR